MTEMNSDKTLSRNSIKNFILRVDLIRNDKLIIRQIAEKMAKHFDRTEKRQLNNFTINFTNKTSNVNTEEVFDFVLISDTNSMNLTFSEIQNAFWLESTQYKNNLVYKNIIDQLIEIISEICDETESKRIGLRYINEFKCDKHKDISQIYGKRLSLILKNMYMVEDKNQSRVIGMEEYNIGDGNKLRLQYGIPNKFYPSTISVCDLLLDIDSFIESTCNISEWQSVIKSLNHIAYAQFTKEINPKYLEALK